MRLHHLFAALPAAALVLNACADTGTPTAPIAASTITTAAAPGGNRLATIEQETTGPALYLQNADGSGRVRVHFDHVHGHVTGNYSSKQLPVTDASIMAIRRARWSPDGRYLAVTVFPAYDVGVVILVSADGHDLQIVSPNSQYLWSDVDWSPDSRRIAYVMATGAFASRPDLFVTELGRDEVRRITTSGKVAGPVVRFDATGTRIYFGEKAGFADDGINTMVRLGTADVGSGAVTFGDTVVGVPQGFSRDGSWALFSRDGGTSAGLLRRATAGGAETLLAGEVVFGAPLLEGDREAIVMTPQVGNPDVLVFRIFGVEQPGDVRGTLPTGPTASWAAVQGSAR